MAYVEQPEQVVGLGCLPLLEAGAGHRRVMVRGGRPIDAAALLGHAQAVAGELPAARCVVNLCEDRYEYLVGFCAALIAGQTTLMPPSRAPLAVRETIAAHASSYCLAGAKDRTVVSGCHRMAPPLSHSNRAAPVPRIAGEQIAAIGYTSGSTGRPQPNRKSFGSFRISSHANLDLLQRHVGDRFELVATVPPQHMYGMEMSVLLPLFGDVGVHAARAFYPSDIAAALQELEQARVLVTTPVHLRALLDAAPAMPRLAAVVSATATMPLALAREAELRLDAPLIEVFGSTETCVFASRRTTQGSRWRLFPGVSILPRPDGCQVDAPHLQSPVILADLVEVDDCGGFQLCGRNSDLLEIAGKRASLGDLTRRLLAIPGVVDGIVFQTERSTSQVRRLAALVVAPNLSETEILDQLRACCDPVFLPRPLRKVDALPRNATGKLPCAALNARLRATAGSGRFSALPKPTTRG